jgi:hypothetical protein
MELEIIDTYEIQTLGNSEEHEQKIREVINRLKPEYYTVSTNVEICVWVSTITVMEST